MNSNNLEKLISLNSAGIEDPLFTTSVSELKSLYAKKRELSQIYTPQSEPMREINRVISEARTGSQNGLRKYQSTFYNELNGLNSQISSIEQNFLTYPERQREFVDVFRGYKIIENAYNLLLSKQTEAQMRVATNRSDLVIIDKAKNLGQGPIAPNVEKT